MNSTELLGGAVLSHQDFDSISVDSWSRGRCTNHTERTTSKWMSSASRKAAAGYPAIHCHDDDVVVVFEGSDATG